MESVNEVKKFKRKIKIRLLDSNNPDSYVCEIFDGSLDNEDIPHFSKEVNSNEPSKEIEESNLKSYFEILMSNGCKKNYKNAYSKENALQYEKTKILQLDAYETNIKTKTINRPKNGEALQLIKVKSKRNCESDSSDEESIFEVKKKKEASISLKRTKFNNFSKSPAKPKIGDVEILYETNTITQRSEFLSQKQNVNILNYFEKIEAKSDEKIDKVTKNLEKFEEIILADTSNKFHVKSCKKMINKENIKLAPLFIKKEKKIIDLAKHKARYDFLHGESKFLKPSDNNKKQDVDFGYYPTCHVQQRDNSIYWSLREMPSSAPELFYLNEFRKFTSGKSIKTNSFSESLVLSSENSENKNEKNKNALIKINAKVINEMKLKYANLNLNSVIDGFKNKTDKFSKLSNDLIASRTGNKKSNSKKSDNDDTNVELFNSLWTQKYKPSSWEILGNETVVAKLKNWLQSWKAFDEELKNSATRKSNKNIDEDEYDDDSDWFVSSDAETCEMKSPGSVCLLSGPSGCGKTALISSLAEELEFNVLEVNASSKRTGKKVLSDFQEATQSHKVQHTSLPIFKNCIRTKEDKRKKNKKLQNQKTNMKDTIEETNDRKISLLLIEDADIVFEEHDEGFYSAIASLVQTSKRPFVFITNNVNCLNLDSFKTEECLLLEMRHPPFNKSCAVLEIVSLLEGTLLKKETAEFLVRQNQFDLRKSLLELQFWNNPSEINLKSDEFDLGHFWWGLSKFLNSPIREPIQPEHIEPVLCKRKRHNVDSLSSNEGETLIKKAKINSKDEPRSRVPLLKSSFPESDRHSSIRFFTDFLDVASTLDLIGLSQNEEPIPCVNYRAKSSLSLEENMEGVFYAERKFKEELSSELTALSARLFTESFGDLKTLEKEVSYLAPSWEDVRWRNSQDEAREELSLLVPSTNGRDGKSMNLDYLPIIRNICRLEKNRSATNSKRKNRFCHYFNGSESQVSGKTLEMSCNVFNN